MRIEIPEFAMVVIMGTSGSGKSTFCRKHFLPTEVLSSDTFRGYVCDDEDSLDVTSHAFEALHYMLGKRLQLGRLTVVDATNVQKEARKQLLKIANHWHALKVLIVLDVPEEVCHERNAQRPNRQFGRHVVRNQRRDLQNSLRNLRIERWTQVYVLRQDDIDSLEIVRGRIWSRRPDEHGPFDIIGDVHGCREELLELVQKMGWELEPTLHHPEDRKLFFVGDLVDRGPDSVGVLKLVMQAVKDGVAHCVPGNHDVKLARALGGADVQTKHGLAETLEQLAGETEEFRNEVREFIANMVSHAVLDDGKLCIAHAGMREEMQGRGSGAVREFALYGETTGEIDEFGLPVRYNWASEYRGKAMVVYGHTPVPEAQWLNGTIDIDTGCCFGGALTALRYPEKQLVSVQAKQVYSEPTKRFLVAQDGLSSQHEADTLLDIADVTGRRSVETRLSGRVTVREENAIAALEIMSRFAADPKWLIYLPPTMSPCETSNRDGFLEYPTEALGYYKHHDVKRVVCEEKHMGSRAVAVVCRDADSARKRFGVEAGEAGIITTRTGRRFFEGAEIILSNSTKSLPPQGEGARLHGTEIEKALLFRMAAAAEKAGLFEELKSDWLLIDLELMPWSAKAVGLLREQYGAVGAASREASSYFASVVEAAKARGLDGLESLEESMHSRLESSEKFVEAYRRYCWRVESLEDYKLAPFHLLASEGSAHLERDHVWHMETLGRMCDADPGILLRTPYRVVDLDSEEEVLAACAWWEDLVGKGGEGMVVKPYDFIPYHQGHPIQPAIKCRGPEYLRIIYGPEYLDPRNLKRLRRRGLAKKRSLASREFALGVEAMERFVRQEPLRKVHECVFGVLAMESEPVDPRL